MLPASSEVRAASLSPDGSRVVIGTNAGFSEIWDAATGQRLVENLRHPDGPIERILFQPDSRSFATVSGINDKYSRFEIRRWSTANGSPLLTPIVEPRLSLVNSGESPDGHVAVVADSYRLRLWDVETGLKLSAAIPLDSEEDYPRESSRHPYAATVFSADGRRLYVETKDSLWMLPLGQIVDSLPSDEDLQAWAELLSGHRIDDAGAYVPMTSADYQTAWSKLTNPIVPQY